MNRKKKDLTLMRLLDRSRAKCLMIMLLIAALSFSSTFSVCTEASNESLENGTEEFLIVSHPQSVVAEAGETVVLSVKADGDGVTYQWQYSRNSGSSWTNCKSGGAKTDTFSFTMSESLAGRLYRCRVTNAAGNSLTSESARISLPLPPCITGQPQSVSAAAGDRVGFSVQTNTDEVQYQWQYSLNGSSWKNCAAKGYNTDMFSFMMKESLDGRLYRCVITRSDGTKEISEAASLSLCSTKPLVILTQPQPVEAPLDMQVSLSVEAAGSDLTYQWEYSKNGGKTWYRCKSTGFNTATFSFKMSAVVDGRLYRCIVNSGDDSLTSEAVPITVKEEGLEITSQPQSVCVKTEETVMLRVEASGNSLSYQWQYSTNGTKWRNCSSAGALTPEFSFVMQEKYDGRFYRCIVSSGEESLISEAAEITFRRPLVILFQPSDVIAPEGSAVSVSVEAEGTDPTYQWQYSKNGGSSWYNCKSAGFNQTTFAFTMSSSLEGRLYRCIVKDGFGETVISEEASISLFRELQITGDSHEIHAEWNTQLALQAVNVPEGEEVIWLSSDPSLARVDNHGMVTTRGEKSGTVIITAETVSQTAEYEVNIIGSEVDRLTFVYGNSKLPGTPSGRLADGEEIIYYKGDGVMVSLTLLGCGVRNDVVWSNSNPEVLGLNVFQYNTASLEAPEDGLSGTSIVTAAVGDETVSVTVHVVDGSALLIRQEAESRELRVGEIGTVTSVLLGARRPWEDYVWTVDAPGILRVDGKGYWASVRALKAGKTSLTLTLGDLSDTIDLEVGERTISESLYITGDTQFYTDGYNSILLEGTMLPLGVDVSVEDESVAIVHKIVNEGAHYALLKGVSPGETRVIVRSGGVEKSMMIQVMEDPNPPSLSFVSDRDTKLPVGFPGKFMINGYIGEYEPIFVSSNPEVLEVSENGIYRTHKEGTALVTLTAGEQEVSAEFEVKGVNLLSINYGAQVLTTTVSEGSSVLSVSGPTTDSRAVSWTSSNPEVASVSRGVLIPHASGNTVVTAEFEGQTASVTVYVWEDSEKFAVYGPQGNQVYLEDAEEKGFQMSVSAVPDGAPVLWTVHDPSMAVITEDGTVYPKQAGTLVIYAEAGDKSASCPVAVIRRDEEPLQILPADFAAYEHYHNVSEINLTEGTEYPLIAENIASAGDILWSSDNTDSVEIIGTAREPRTSIFAKTAGTSTVSVRADNRTTSIQVHVHEVTNTDLAFGSGQMEIDYTRPTNEEDRITIMNAEQNVPVIVSVSDESIAEIDNHWEEGYFLLNPKKAGSVTVTMQQGDRSASRTYYLGKNPLSLSLDRMGTTVYAGECLLASVTGRDGQYPLEWSVSDDSIAEILPDEENRARVILKKEGRLTVTAACGEETSSCTMTVKPADQAKIRIFGSIPWADEAETYVECGLGSSFYLMADRCVYGGTVRFESSDESVLSCDGDFAYVNGYGTVTIRAISTNGSATWEGELTLESRNAALEAYLYPLTASDTVYPGDSIKFYLMNYDADLVTVTNSDPSVVSVPCGTDYAWNIWEIVALRPGMSVITLQCGEETAEIVMTVADPSGVPLTTTLGETVELTADAGYFFRVNHYVPEDGITVSVSDESLARVEAEGVQGDLPFEYYRLYPMNTGTVDLILKSGEKTASVPVRIIKNPIGISYYAYPFRDESCSFSAYNYLEPVEWTVSDPSIAEIRYIEDWSGYQQSADIHFLKVGEVTITARSGGEETSVVVQVQDDSQLDMMIEGFYDGNWYYGRNHELKVLHALSDGQTVFSSSDESVATIQGNVLKALRTGDTTITAVSDNGETQKTVSVNCHFEFQPMVVSDGSGIQEDQLWYEEEQHTLYVSDYEGTLTWTSSDETVVRIDEICDNGANLFALAPGISVISVTDGDQTAELLVEVCSYSDHPMEIGYHYFHDGSRVIDMGQYMDHFYLNYAEEGGTVTWTSSDENVLTVDEAGYLYPHQPGIVTVTAVCTGEYKTKEASREVEIVDIPLSLIVKYTDGEETAPSELAADETYYLQINGMDYMSEVQDIRIDDPNVAEIVYENGNHKLIAKSCGSAEIVLVVNSHYRHDDAQPYEETVVLPIEVKDDSDMDPVIVDEAGKGRYLTMETDVSLRVAHVPDGEEVASWTSSNTDIATVDENGRVFLTGCGDSVTITANLTNGQSCQYEFYYVYEMYELPSLSADLNWDDEVGYYLNTGEGAYLYLDCNRWSWDLVSFTSSNPEILEVSQYEKCDYAYIAGISEGYATVTVTTPTRTLEYSVYVMPVNSGGTVPEQPEETEPETLEPETTEPETLEPETTEPETLEPETTEPETLEPETLEPEMP